MNEAPQPPSRWAPWLGAGVDAVIARGMSKRPADRYPDVTSFADALRAAVGVIAVDRRRVPRLASSRIRAEVVPRPAVASLVEPPERRSQRGATSFRRRSPSRSVALALAAAAAIVWLSPMVRTAARSAWHHGGAKVRGLVATTTSPRQDPEPPGEVPAL